MRRWSVFELIVDVADVDDDFAFCLCWWNKNDYYADVEDEDDADADAVSWI